MSGFYSTPPLFLGNITTTPGFNNGVFQPPERFDIMSSRSGPELIIPAKWENGSYKPEERIIGQPVAGNSIEFRRYP